MKELRSYVCENERLSKRKQCELLEINRSTIYYISGGESEENLEVMRLIDEEHLDHPTHGVLQLQDYLFALGFIVNHKRVRRLMRKMGITAIYPGKNLSRLGQAEYLRPYLLRGKKVTKRNEVWEIDITYIPMGHGFMYMVGIIDVYSRYIVAWDIFNSLDAENCLKVMKRAISKHGEPEIINSDQGSQFTSALWTGYIENETQTKISMDGKGRATDNIYIERFWRTLKRDHVYLYPAEDGVELFRGIEKFINYYNHEKTHQGIERQIPVNIYFAA